MSRETAMRGQAQPSARGRSYSYGQHGKTTRGMMGDHTLRKGAGVEVWKPSWKQTTTTLRVYPAICPENPEVWDPWRFSSDDDDYGDWIRTYPAVRNFGDPGVTFILCDPTDQAYDAQTNPCWLLFNAINRAVQAGQANPKWVPYTLGSAGRGAALRRPQDITLIQGAILQHNNKDYDPPRGGAVGDTPVVIELSGSAAQAMLEAMNERTPEFRGNPDDYQGMFVHGDPIAIDRGMFVNFYQLGADPRERQASGQRRASSFGQNRPGSGGGGGGRDEAIGYGCFLTNEYRGMGPDLSPVEEMVRRKVRPWDSLVQILDHEQQIRLLSGAFPPDMILYGLEDTYRELIPQSVFNNYQSSIVQGAAMAQHQAPRNAPQDQAAGQRRGWGAPAPADAAPPATDEADEDAGQYVEGDLNDPNYVEPVEQAPPVQQRQPQRQPQQAPPAQQTRQTPTQPQPQRQSQQAPPSQNPPHTAGQRRGFGASAPASGDVVQGETAPTSELPDAPPAGGFDNRPQGAPAAGQSVLDAVRASKERMNRRRAGGTASS